MSALDLRTVARALGGEVSGRDGVLCPGPGHSRRDRSLSVRLSRQNPTGFVVFSHAGDAIPTCKDYVREKLGLDPNSWKRQDKVSNCSTLAGKRPETDDDDRRKRIVRAVEIWAEARDAAGSVVEQYLASRGLRLPDDSDALRYHPRCPWAGDDGKVIRVPAMICVMRTIDGDEIRAIHKTRLTSSGEKVGRKIHGPSSGCAIKLSPDDSVTTGLVVGEGVETSLTAYQFGLRPVWALGAVDPIRTLKVLSGVDAITLLAETGAASERAIADCAARWDEAGREVLIVKPVIGDDINTALQKGAA